MKNINNFTQWKKNGSVDVTFMRAITHRKQRICNFRRVSSGLELKDRQLIQPIEMNFILIIKLSWVLPSYKLLGQKKKIVCLSSTNQPYFLARLKMFLKCIFFFLNKLPG